MREQAVDITALMAADAVALLASRAGLSLQIKSSGEELQDTHCKWLDSLVKGAEKATSLLEYVDSHQRYRFSNGLGASAQQNCQQEEDGIAGRVVRYFNESVRVCKEIIEEPAAVTDDQMDAAMQALAELIDLCAEIRAKELE